MKTASVRDIRQNFPRVMAWIADGEQVKITMRRKVIARLVPEKAPPRHMIELPDFPSIRKEIFGNQNFDGNLAEQEREGSRW